MSSLLYRLGRWCAGHAWRTLALWLALLVGLGVLAGTVGKPLTSQISIPGTTFQKVIDGLGKEIPAAAGSAGTVVLQSADGTPMTDAQRAAAEEVFATWAQVPHVKQVNNPFEAQAQLDKSATDLAAATTTLEAGQKGSLMPGQGAARAGPGPARRRRGPHHTARGGQPGRPDPARAAGPGEGRPPPAGEGPGPGRAGRGRPHRGPRAVRGRQDRHCQGTAGTRLVTKDGTHAVVQIQFDENAQSVPVDDRAQIPARGDAALKAAGLTAAYSVEITQDTSLIGPGEVLGLTVALIVLVVMLGSLIAAGLPLLVALLGVGVGLAGAVAFTYFTDLNTMTPSLALMLGLAVGIDYALFIVNRHRGNILRGDDLHESIARSVATAGSAVVFAGTTVVIALAALVLSGLPILAQMGLVAAATVAVTVVVAVTVGPAVLAPMKTRVVSKRGWRSHGFSVPGDVSTRNAPAHEREEEHGGWYVGAVTRGSPWSASSRCSASCRSRCCRCGWGCPTAAAKPPAPAHTPPTRRSPTSSAPA